MSDKTAFQQAVLNAADETDPDARRQKILIVQNWPVEEIEAELVPANRSDDGRTEFAYTHRCVAYSHINGADYRVPYVHWAEHLVNWMTDPVNRKEAYPNG